VENSKARLESRQSSASDSLAMAQLAAEAAMTRKALDVRILDLHGIASFTDFFIICSGTSDTHLEGITAAIQEKMEESNHRLWHREGERKSEWVLLDYVDVVVHLFSRKAREFYGLERLWAEATCVPIQAEDVSIDPEWEDVDAESLEVGEFTAEDDEWDEEWDENEE
jgi:ribosome-associated protein